MNNMERVLHDDLARLVDWLAVSIPEGAWEKIRATTPSLRSRVDQTEARLAALYASLLEDYGRWKRALEDLENIWALAAWRSQAEESTAEPRRLAA